MSTELEALNDLEEFMGGISEKLDKTPYDYTIYIRWIELLRAVGDIDSMRTARMAMLSRLAVPEEVWTEWIEDEKTQKPDGFGDAGKIRHIKKLFDIAVREYMLPSMWQKYIDFVKELGDAEGDDVRAAAGEVFGHGDFVLDVLEQGVSATKAHYCDSQAIWVQYKSYLEHCIIEAEDSRSNTNRFIGVLQGAFLERLGAPHAEVEETFNMYSEFVTKNIADSEYESQMVYATSIVGNTRIKCTKRESLEGQVSASGGSWYSFSLYIDKLSREKQVDYNEIACIFERALVKNYCYPEVWDEYITTLTCSLESTGEALLVAGRAVRNCPWSGKLWAQVLSLAYVCYGYQHAADIYNSVVSTHALEHSMLEFSYMAISFVSAARQEYQAGESKAVGAEQLLSICNACIDAAYKLDISTADPTLRFERCCTFIAASILCNEAEARKLWIRICKARGSCTEAWLLSAEFEQVYGSDSNARGVYHHAAQRRLDNPERLFDAWLTFEHNFGEQTTVSKAEDFVNKQRRLIQKRAERRSVSDNTRHLVAPQAESTEMEYVDVSLKRTHGDANQDGQAQGSEAVQDIAQTTYSRNSNESTSTSAAAIPTTVGTAVFVSNLPASYTETQLMELLGGTVCVDSVELLKSNDGSFRGQAKVHLRSTDALVSALDKNGFRLDNQHISIHIFKQHYHGARQVSVTVTGFSQETGNKKIESIAKATGGFVRIRRNQQGDVAHVVMKSMDDAVRAVLELDGCVVDGNSLEASVSDIPEANASPITQKKRRSAQTTASTSLLVPRKMVVPSRRPAKRVKVVKRDADDVSSKAEEVGKKSNDEFRQIFLDNRDKL